MTGGGGGGGTCSSDSSCSVLCTTPSTCWPTCSESHTPLNINFGAHHVTCTRVSLQMLPHADSTAATRERVASDSVSIDFAAAAAALFAAETSARRLPTIAARSLSDLLSNCCMSCWCCSSRHETITGEVLELSSPAAVPASARLCFAHMLRTERLRHLVALMLILPPLLQSAP
jgi:hypothetical protein